MNFKKHLNKIILLTILVAILGTYFLLPKLYFRKGMSAFNANNFQKACKNFEIARKWNKNNSYYNFYYVRALSKLKPTYDVQKKICDIAASRNKDRAQKFAENVLNTWRSNLYQAYGPNYINQAPQNGDIIRWNPKTFPLKVYIDYNNSDKYPDYYNVVFTRAFNQWHLSVNFLSFDFTTSPDNADIVINLKGTPNTGCQEAGCKYVLAHTEPVIKKHILKKMIITIYDKDASGAFFSDKELYNTTLHEIGHALGIMGHSYSTDDLMYMQNEVNSTSNTIFIQSRSSFQYISLSDISTLRLLYNIVPTITNTPLSEIKTSNLVYPEVILGNTKVRSNIKLKEAKNYIKNAPDLPGGYIDLAVAYDDLGQFDKALNAFQEALVRAKTQEDQYLIYYNIATLHLNHDKPTEALQYANQAKNINPSDEIAELISNIEHALNTNSKPFWSPWGKKQ